MRTNPKACLRSKGYNKSLFWTHNLVTGGFLNPESHKNSGILELHKNGQLKNTTVYANENIFSSAPKNDKHTAEANGSVRVQSPRSWMKKWYPSCVDSWYFLWTLNKYLRIQLCYSHYSPNILFSPEAWFNIKISPSCNRDFCLGGCDPRRKALTHYSWIKQYLYFCNWYSGLPFRWVTFLWEEQDFIFLIKFRI